MKLRFISAALFLLIVSSYLYYFLLENNIALTVIVFFLTIRSVRFLFKNFWQTEGGIFIILMMINPAVAYLITIRSVIETLGIPDWFWGEVSMWWVVSFIISAIIMFIYVLSLSFGPENN